MPLITVELWEGRGVEEKKRLAKGITNVVTDNIKCPESAVTVIFRDVPMHNWAIGGQLASETFKGKVV